MSNGVYFLALSCRKFSCPAVYFRLRVRFRHLGQIGNAEKLDFKIITICKGAIISNEESSCKLLPISENVKYWRTVFQDIRNAILLLAKNNLAFQDMPGKERFRLDPRL